MKRFIGIDLGTSSVKILIANESGKIEFSGTKNYEILSPLPLYSEQDPTIWYDYTIAVLKEALKSIDPNTIEAISFAGQMHGLVMLDKDDKVIRPCILWNDGRSHKESDYLNNQLKNILKTETGNISFPGFTLPKLLWVKENEPENFSRIDKIMLPKDYLVYKFSNAFVSDYSDMSGSLFMSVKDKKYSEKILQIAGISCKNLPTLHESYECVGKINKEIINILGLKETTKIIVGAGDNAASAIGSGCLDTNNPTISLGTSATIFLPLEKYDSSCHESIHHFANADGKYHHMACILSGASSTKWWVEDILHSTHENEYKIEEEKLGTNDVLYAPYLSGERCPHNDPFVKGAFVNLSLNTTREDMLLAVLEGVAFALRNCKEKIEEIGHHFNKITLVGGGSKNTLWTKILSNILNVEIYKLKNEQGPSFGACILAMVGSGLYSNVYDAVNKLVEKELLIKPNKEISQKYNKIYSKYIKIYHSLKLLNSK